MDTILVLGSGILFFIISSIVIFDCKKLIDQELLPYPMGFGLDLKHLWTRRIAKVLLVIATIMWLLVPFLGDVIIGKSDDPVAITTLNYVFVYIFLACIWYLGQILIFLVSCVVWLIFGWLWAILKGFVSWITA